jgi:hypothetical protein
LRQKVIAAAGAVLIISVRIAKALLGIRRAVSGACEVLHMPQSNAKKFAQAIQQRGWLGKITGYLKALGPGLITGASDDDPSGIGTYAQTGAQFRYAPLWTALFTFPLMTAVQEMCARIALHTGRGLADISGAGNLYQL